MDSNDNSSSSTIGFSACCFPQLNMETKTEQARLGHLLYNYLFEVDHLCQAVALHMA